MITIGIIKRIVCSRVGEVIMDIVIEVGTERDIDELENLYNELNDYLKQTVNYPGWIKGVYPIRQTAIDGVRASTLYVARSSGKIVGSIILNNKAEVAYNEVEWEIECDHSEVFVIHTFVVHPKFMKYGVGKALIDFCHKKAMLANVKAIRLDVYEGNTPAIQLYERCGYVYMGTVDLGLRQYGLEWFKLYQKRIKA
jgi:ribosomal protein S18 acetylase RimI-like enzyme